MNEWYDWLVNHVPKTIKKKVSTAFTNMKNKIMSLYRDEDTNPVLKTSLVSTAINDKTRKWIIDGGGVKDPIIFLNITTEQVEKVINETDSVGKKVFTVLTCKMKRSDPATGNVEMTVIPFRSKTHGIITPEDATRKYDEMKDKMLESMASHQRQGSGWALHSVENLTIHITKYRPLNGRGWKDLPKFIKRKYAIVNPQNTDEECIKYAVTIGKNLKTNAKNPNPKKKKNLGKITEILKKQANEEFNWEGVEFPTKLKDISKIEKNNDLVLHVLSFDEETKKVFPLRIGGFPENHDDEEKCIILFLWDGHYSVVKNFIRLVSTQLSKSEHTKFICIRCLSAAFGTQILLDIHLELCRNHDHQHSIYPNEKNNTMMFKHFHKLHKLAVVIYADFECFIEGMDTVEGNPNKSSTMKYQKHTPSGFCYHIKFFDEKDINGNPICEGKTVRYTMKEEGEDIGKIFMEYLEKDLKEIHEILDNEIPLTMTKENSRDFKKAKFCYACGEELGKDRVRDHCHHTGRYRGAVHNECNLKMRVPKFVPVIFHNLEGYDSHLFVKSMGLTLGKIKCIPKTDEKYISFGKEIVMGTYLDKKGNMKNKTLEVRFLDSLKFTLKSLDGLVGTLGPDQFKTLEKEMGTNKLLKKKGAYPYEFMDGFDKLGFDKLPPQKDFYSKLNDEGISDEKYEHAKKVWKEFGCKTMRDYHDLYLMTDVMLLADVMENYRDICLKNYGLDPMWCYTSPGLSLEACLKITGVKLELLTDPDMYLMFEQGIRGGISTVTKRHAKANNKYMKDYDSTKESVYIQYLDANNLYGWAMTQHLPVNGFEWMNEDELHNWESICEEDGKGCILEVDLEYPKELHDLHNEYPLAPEKLKVGEVEKLIPNLMNKEKYVLHYRNLKLYLSLGMKLTKVHRGIKFNERPWLKEYIQLNTDLRTKATSDFEKDLFKLMNNSLFGKTMENVRNRKDVRLVNDENVLERLTRMINFHGVNIFTEDLIAVHMKRTTVHLNKPIYLGMCILDLSKTLMYDFHYNYIKPKYGEKVSLLFTDTDSLCYEIKTEDFYKDIENDVHTWFDTSNFPENHPSGIPIGVNKKVVGMMKDEAGGRIVIGFVGLRSKLYAYLMDDEHEEKKCKGVKKGVVKKEITFEDYKTCLFSGEKLYRSMNTFRSRNHDIYTERINKVALSSNDDKRYILEDGINTLALGHRRITSEN